MEKKNFKLELSYGDKTVSREFWAQWHPGVITDLKALHGLDVKEELYSLVQKALQESIQKDLPGLIDQLLNNSMKDVTPIISHEEYKSLKNQVNEIVEEGK